MNGESISSEWQATTKWLQCLADSLEVCPQEFIYTPERGYYWQGIGSVPADNVWVACPGMNQGVYRVPGGTRVKLSNGKDGLHCPL